MPKDTRISREKHQPTSGKTDYKRLNNMSEEEIEANAEQDPDAPLVRDEDLKKFARINPKEKQHGKENL